MRQTGTVKFFNQAKGFGFITPDEGGKDVFVHISAVERSGVGMLDEGMRVTYETQPDPKGKGPKAVKSRALRIRRRTRGNPPFWGFPILPVRHCLR